MATASTTATSSSSTRSISTSTSTSTNNHNGRISIPCRYFMDGQCREGPRCRFTHDLHGARSNINLCKYFLLGRCTWGETCKYEHARPVVQQQSQQQNDEDGAEGTSSGSSTVKKTNSSKMAAAASSLLKTKLRADAQEFIPTWMRGGDDRASAEESVPLEPKDILCPYHILGQCWYGEQCTFLHGAVCDMCDRPVLHPSDEEANRKHREECLAEHESDMKASFAIARTKEKQCGICMEIVLEKTNLSARRFGILPSCKHSFCLDCIRQWRLAKTFENKVIRACPECRTVSDFVVPSQIWVDDEEEKRSLIDSYKTALKEKVCKYYKADGDGKSECPFGNKCFYRHVRPDGSVVQGDSPRTIRRRQRQRQRRENRGQPSNNNNNGDGNEVYLLWNVLDDDNDDWRHNFSPDDWEYAFEYAIEDEIDWLSLSDSESDYYDY